MASFNQAIVIGFVGDEPKASQSQSGTTVASIAVATTEKGYTRPDGTRTEDRTEWHSVVFFAKQAEIISKFVHKGSQIMVQGKMRTRSYEDRQGVKRYVTDIVSDVFQILDRRPLQSQSATTDEPMPYL